MSKRPSGLSSGVRDCAAGKVTEPEPASRGEVTRWPPEASLHRTRAGNQSGAALIDPLALTDRIRRRFMPPSASHTTKARARAWPSRVWVLANEHSMSGSSIIRSAREHGSLRFCDRLGGRRVIGLVAGSNLARSSWPSASRLRFSGSPHKGAAQVVRPVGRAVAKSVFDTKQLRPRNRRLFNHLVRESEQRWRNDNIQ